MRQEFSLNHPVVELLIDLVPVYISPLKFLSIRQLILAILVRKVLQIKNDGVFELSLQHHD